METNYSKEDKYLRAKKRVKELKGFYIHLAVYLVINAFITVNKVIKNVYDGETIGQAISDFGTFAVWIFWGIGLAIHGLNVFGLPFIFGKDWEVRKIKKFLEEDKDQFKTL
jgi:hypothetical protein